MDLRLTGSSNCAKAWTVWFKKLNFCTKANTLKLNPIVFPVPRTTHSCFHKCPFVKLTDHVDPEYQKSFPPPSSLPTVYPIFTLGILFFFTHHYYGRLTVCYNDGRWWNVQGLFLLCFQMDKAAHCCRILATLDIVCTG